MAIRGGNAERDRVDVAIGGGLRFRVVVVIAKEQSPGDAETERLPSNEASCQQCEKRNCESQHPASSPFDPSSVRQGNS